MDRGGQKVIGEPMWNFLVGLSGILRVAEKKDGSVLHEDVLALAKADEGVICFRLEFVRQTDGGGK